jgi:hypothetical protein
VALVVLCMPLIKQLCGGQTRHVHLYVTQQLQQSNNTVKLHNLQKRMMSGNAENKTNASHEEAPPQDVAFGTLWYNDWVQDGANLEGRNCFTICLVSKVCAFLEPHMHPEQKQMKVDRGRCALQIDVRDGVAFLALFAREKTDDTQPDFVIPMGSIWVVNGNIKASRNNNYQKGVMTILTRSSLDTKVTMKPMLFTLKMDTDGFMALHQKVQWAYNQFDRTGLILE